MKTGNPFKPYVRIRKLTDYECKHIIVPMYIIKTYGEVKYSSTHF